MEPSLQLLENGGLEIKCGCGGCGRQFNQTYQRVKSQRRDLYYVRLLQWIKLILCRKHRYPATTAAAAVYAAAAAAATPTTAAAAAVYAAAAAAALTSHLF